MQKAHPVEKDIESIRSKHKVYRLKEDEPGNKGKYNNFRHTDISLLSAEEREQAFLDFSEGEEGLYNLLKTAYDHGIESLYSCKGHYYKANLNIVLAYIVLRVTKDNINLLRQIGRAVSHEQIETIFEYGKYGNLVTFKSPALNMNKNWFNVAAEIIKNPPKKKIIPISHYYTEAPCYRISNTKVVAAIENKHFDKELWGIK